MPPWPRAVLFSLLAGHATLVAMGDRLPERMAPAVAGTVYLPLWPLQALGLPVFGRAEAGGWPGPSLLGWVVVAVIWAAIWWLAVTAVARLCRRA